MMLEYYCDSCTQLIPLGAHRFHCPDCDDFDYCGRCNSEKKARCFYSYHKDMYLEVRDREDALRAIWGCNSGVGHCINIGFKSWPNRPLLGLRHEEELEEEEEEVEESNAADTAAASSQRQNIPPSSKKKTKVVFKYQTYNEVYAKCAPIAWKLLQMSYRFDKAEGRLPAGEDDGDAILTEEDDDYDNSADAVFAAAKAKSAWQDKHVDVEDTSPHHARVGIILENCPEWVYWDFAVALSGCVLVPIDSAASVEVISNILSSTKPIAILSSAARASEVNTVLQEIKLQAQIIISTEYGEVMPGTEALQETIDDAARIDTSFIVGAPPVTGRLGDNLTNFQWPSRNDDELFTLLFTSGSTGAPKGAMVTHRAFRYGAHDRRVDPYTACIYRPLSYATDRDMVHRVFANGGRLCLMVPPVERWMFNEVALVNPSTFSAPPRIYNMMYERFCADMRNAIRKKLLDDHSGGGGRGRSSSFSGDDDGGCGGMGQPTASKGGEGWQEWIMTPRNSATDAVWKKYRDLLGRRVRGVTIGSAPPRPEVVRWMRECFELRGDASVFESYGTTESGGLTANGRCSFGARLKLIPIEGDERPADLPDYIQRGEIVSRTDSQIAGYWGFKEATDKLFHIDEDGHRWVRSGDIAEFDTRDHERTYKLVGRISCVVKMANGTFISPEVLEGALQVPQLRDICIYAAPGFEQPIAIVSLNDKFFSKMKKDEEEDEAAAQQMEREESSSSRSGGGGGGGGMMQQRTTSVIVDPDAAAGQQLLGTSDISKVTPEGVCRLLRDVGIREKVPVSQLPFAVIIAETFTRENKLCTISMKVSRPEIKRRFGEQANRMHGEMLEKRSAEREQQQQQQQAHEGGVGGDNAAAAAATSATAGSAADESPKFIVSKIFEQVLGSNFSAATADDVENQSAISLGADSLIVGVLREKIGRATGVSIPIREFGFMKLYEIAERIKNRDAGASSSSSQQRETKKQDEAEKLRQLRNTVEDDIRLSNYCGPRVEQESGTMSQQQKQRHRGFNVFVTGGTGFIGIHVLAEQLRAGGGGDDKKANKVVFALVRAGSGSIEDATAKLVEAAQRYKVGPCISDGLASGELRVIIGDLESDLVFADLNAFFFAAADDDSDGGGVRDSVGELILCGAFVNHFLPYQSLAKSNVRSLRTLLHLFHNPNLAELPRVVFASSVSVDSLTTSRGIANNRGFFDDGDDESKEEEEEVVAPVRKSISDDDLRRASGYALTKWAAERLLKEAMNCGLAAPTSRIARVGMTSWSSHSGAANTSDWLVTLTLAIAYTRRCPFTTFPMGLSPVNWIAGELVKLSRTTSSSATSSTSTLVLLDNQMTIDMVGVWKKLLDVLGSGGDNDSNVPTGMSFADFMLALTAAAEDPAWSSSSVKQVKQRFELLFSALPRGDFSRSLSPDKSEKHQKEKSESVVKFCRFISSVM